MKTIKTVKFKYFDPRDDGREPATDCVIRSYSAAFGITWREAFTIATLSGIDHDCMPNDGAAIFSVLHDMKCRKQTLQGGITVCDFAKAHPKGKYIILLREHATTLIDGVITDTWDTSKKKIEYAYKVPSDKVLVPILNEMHDNHIYDIFKNR